MMMMILYDVGKVLYKYCTSTFPISTLTIMFMYIMWWYIYEYHSCNCFVEINSIQFKKKTYMNERQQYVDLDGTTSNNNRILTGVPQGSILGPRLFIIYINDITQSSKHFNVIIYADDTTLCSTLKINADDTQLNMELNNVSQWLNLNKLSLNVKKAMAFRMP